MKQLRTVHHNNVNITGFLVKDAFVAASGKMASFRIGHSCGRDRKSIFLNCVIFATEENPLPMDFLKKGETAQCLDITGHFRAKEVTRKDGTKFDDLEVIVDSIALAETKEVEVDDSAAAPAAPAPTADDDLPAGVTDDLPLGPDEQ